MQQLKPGSKLNNKYRILRFIGQGGLPLPMKQSRSLLVLKSVSRNFL